MTETMFVFLGPGCIMIDPAGLPGFPKDLKIERHIYQNSGIAFAPLSRLPKSAIPAQLLAELVSQGRAALSDAGIPGPSTEHVRQCFTRSLADHGERDAEAFKAALRAVYKASRAGIPEAHTIERMV
jgi:hypothetical protein